MNELKEKRATDKWLGLIGLTIAVMTTIWCSLNAASLMN